MGATVHTRTLFFFFYSSFIYRYLITSPLFQGNNCDIRFMIHKTQMLKLTFKKDVEIRITFIN